MQPPKADTCRRPDVRNKARWENEAVAARESVMWPATLSVVMCVHLHIDMSGSCGQMARPNTIVWMAFASRDRALR